MALRNSAGKDAELIVIAFAISGQTMSLARSLDDSLCLCLRYTARDFGSYHTGNLPAILTHISQSKA
jgi:hypothetical protein